MFLFSGQSGLAAASLMLRFNLYCSRFPFFVLSLISCVLRDFKYFGAFVSLMCQSVAPLAAVCQNIYPLAKNVAKSGGRIRGGPFPPGFKR